MDRLDGPNTPQALRLIKLIARPLRYLDDYGDRYGDIFRVGQSSPPVVYVSHPDAIQTILTASPDHFSVGKNGGGRFLRYLMGDDSVLLLDGDRHARQRKLLMPPFHGDRLRTYSQIMGEIAQEVSDQWQPGQQFRVRAVMQDITLRVILKAVFGVSEGDRFDHLHQLLSSMMDSLSSPLSASLIFFPALQKDWGSLSPWGRFVRRKEQVDQIIYAEIKDRRAHADEAGDDILSVLMTARDEDGQPMSDSELRDELMTLLIAGHETTASALTWALYWIHTRPEVEATVRSELENLGDRLEPNEITKLPYLNALCQETLRIYPVTLTTGVRILSRPLNLMGYALQPGTVLFPCIYLVHHRDNLYPDSKSFQPERFLHRQFSPYEYLPFGGGHRRCIGAAMAMLEMKLVLATLVANWQFSLASDRPLKPVRRGITIAPSSNFKMVAIRRIS
ncbi:MAG: cytochrome P450 [Elainellaceae cyanobacterium]